MKILHIILLVLLIVPVGSIAPAQVIRLSEALSNAEAHAQIARSNAEAKAQADRGYLQLHPDQATNALAPHQLELLDATANPTTRSNYLAQHHSQIELEDVTNTMRFYLTNAGAQSSYFFHLHGMTEAEYSTNVLLTASRHKPPPQPWPTATEKQVIFGNCSSLLRSAIDEDKIHLACESLTNRPDAVRALKTIANEAQSSLNGFADLLFDPHLESYWGYRAKLITTTNQFFIDFWFISKSASNAPVRSIEKRTTDGLHVLVSASFYQTGKLEEFAKAGESVFFNENGTVRNFEANSTDVWLP